MFTDGQIEVINRLIDQRVAAIITPKRTARPKQYHTVQDIRNVILENLDSLRQELGDGEFDIAVLRHCLGRKMQLLDADFEPVGKVPYQQPRWEHQITNALNSENWPSCPIVCGSRRRSYKFVTPVVIQGSING